MGSWEEIPGLMDTVSPQVCGGGCGFAPTGSKSHRLPPPQAGREKLSPAWALPRGHRRGRRGLALQGRRFFPAKGRGFSIFP